MRDLFGFGRKAKLYETLFRVIHDRYVQETVVNVETKIFRAGARGERGGNFSNSVVEGWGRGRRFAKSRNPERKLRDF